jgi:PBSX family phage terminase large subunit
VKAPLSQKQIKSYQEATARLNIWEGSVRSGKTFSSILKFIDALKHGPPGNAMIIGVSRDALQRNVLGDLCGLYGFPIPTPKATQLNLFNRIIFLVGANDERAQRRIQGSTLALAYVDEITLIPYGFFKMLLSRLSVDGAQLFGTCNPDSPFHWLKQEYLDNHELDLNSWKFRIDDNPSLSEKYITALKSEYQGLWYRRYIEGEWILAEGTVYDFFDEEKHIIDFPPRRGEFYVVGIDYGTSNPCVFVLIGFNRQAHPNMWCEKEYYFNSREEQRQKTDTEYAEDLKAFIEGYPVASIYVDPSAASFKVECYKQGIDQIADADNDVLNGIRFQSQLLANGAYKICRACKNTCREYGTYIWDTKASNKGEDKPVKEHDHAMDAQRYALYTHWGHDMAGHIRPDEIDKMYAAAVGASGGLPPMFQQPLTHGQAHYF